jgi:hypothetical protein
LVVPLALAPALLAAQTVQGQVLDTATGRPVVSATIVLLRGEQGEHGDARGVTDEQGHFSLHAPASGTYRLRCMVIGYQPVTTPPFDLLRDDDPLDVEVRMSPVAVLLAPLTIVSQRPPRLGGRWLEMEGYYDRQHRYGREGLGIGRFLDREEIDRTVPYNVSDIFRMMPGVRVEGRGGQSQVITFRSMTFGGRCVPTVFINGMPAATGADVNDLITPFDLAAVEVYAGGITPGEFMNRGTDPCGAIALWTGYTGDRRSRQDTLPAAKELALDLALSADSVSLHDSLTATLTVINLSDDTRSLCITGSYYTLRGAGTGRDVTNQIGRDPCVNAMELGPRASWSWREIVNLDQGNRAGLVLIQKVLQVRAKGCAADTPCETVLLSGWKHVMFVANPGGS